MYVLDTCAFLTQNHPKKKVVTIVGIEKELKNKQSKQYFSNLKTMGLKILEPNKESIDVIKKHARKRGDLGVLSTVDLTILALAYEIQGTIISDDFAIQNVALFTGIDYKSCNGKEITEMRFWKYRCSACNSIFEEEKENCHNCGKNLVFRIKSK